MKDSFTLHDKYGQTLDLKLLYPTTMVPGGQASVDFYRPYGSRAWSIAGDRLPSPEPWSWQGRVTALSYEALRSYLSSLETFARNAIQVSRSSDSAYIDLAGGGRPLATIQGPTVADVTIAFFPTTDAWSVVEARAFNDGTFGESVYPDTSGIRRTY